MKKTDYIAVGIILVIIILSYLNLSKGLGTGNSDFSDRIAIIPVQGVILDSEKFIHNLNYFAKKSSVKGLIIQINSPGGATTPSQEMYEAILAAKEKYNKPIYASISTLGASGGYFIALAADVIFAASTSLTGSIGVIMDLPQYAEIMNKIGINMNIIKSGELKDSGSPYREMNNSDQKYFQTLVDDIYFQFASLVAERRHMSLEEVKPLAQGQAFTGKQAFENGLIDTLGTLQQCIEALAEELDLGENPKIIKPKKTKLTVYDVIFGDIDNIFSKFIESPTLQMIYK